MKTVLVARHAKSSWNHAGLDDHDRPLNKRGIRDAPRLGEWIKGQCAVPQRILCSTAVRAKTTAQAVAEVLNCADLREDHSLYGGEAREYIEALRALPDSVSCAMIVGHNPDVEDLISLLTGVDEVMPTAALAEISIPIDSWGALSPEIPAELKRMWRPKEE